MACWNACNGVSTERLEDMGRPLMAHLIGCDERAARMVKERGELLAALKRLMSSDVSIVAATDGELLDAVNDKSAGPVIKEMAASVLQARAAIAAAQGEQP